MFEKKITLGNVISTFAIIISGIVVFINMKVEIAIISNNLTHLQTDFIKSASDINEISKSVSNLLVTSATQANILQDVQLKQKDQVVK